MPVARKILDHFGVLLDDHERTRLLDGILYKYNYPKTQNVFREGAREVLHSLAGSATFIVTNSHTEPVQAKVRDLSEAGDLDWLVERVYGRAKKYVVDDGFELLPSSFRIEGLGRPVLLRRQLYYERISTLLEEAGAGWEDLLVVGDIFELDLALPLHMGAQVGLVVNGFTPAYELEYLDAHPRGHLIHSLREIPGLFGA